MSKTPYPGFPPNYKSVPTVNGLTRQCLVVEVRSTGPLDNGQIALIKEQLEGTVERLVSKVATIQNAELIDQERFDPILTEALRLKKIDGRKS